MTKASFSILSHIDDLPVTDVVPADGAPVPDEAWSILSHIDNLPVTDIVPANGAPVPDEVWGTLSPAAHMSTRAEQTLGFLLQTHLTP